MRVTVDQLKDIQRVSRVTVDGYNVTGRCQEADEERGFAMLLCGDPAHRDWKKTEIGAHLVPDDQEGNMCRCKAEGTVKVTLR